MLDTLQVEDAISVPWRAGDERLGLVAAYNSRRSEGFSREDAWVLQNAGLAAGLVWQLKYAETDLKKTVERLQKVDAARQMLLKNVSTSVEMTAIMDREGTGKVIGPHLTLRADKGIEAGAYAIAAGVWLLDQGHPVPPGLHLPDEAFPLNPIMESVEKFFAGSMSGEVAGVESGRELEAMPFATCG